MLKPKFWLGLAGVGVLLTSLIYAGQRLADVNAGLINDVLGLSTQKIGKIDSDEVEGSAYVDEEGSLYEDGWKQLIKDSYKFSEELVEQGSVLFKNDEVDGEPVLPLKENERKVTLFGRGGRNLYYRSGAGGAAPNDDLVVTLDQAFENCDFQINKTVFGLYSEASRSGQGAEMSNPNSTIEAASSVYTQAAKDSFAEYNDAAIVTLVRVGTENTDPNDGKLELNQNEKDMLDMIDKSGQFKKTIVLINGPLAMSVDWANDYGIDAVIFLGVPGYYGVEGIVHVLMGKDREGNPISPSGHAVDTFARSASSSPAKENFGNSSMVVYQEGVYVGYKYYETRYEDCVLGQGNADGAKGIKYSEGGHWNYAQEMGYPFGWGMSYSTFDRTIKSVKHNKTTDQIEVKVEVKNTGDMKAKDVVQVYAQIPYTQHDRDNELGRSAISLMAYEKVELEPNQTKTVDLAFDRYFLCTYDYKEYKTYILEGGEYYFAVGNGAHEALNNIISVKEGGAVLYDHNGDPYQGDANSVAKLTLNDDFETFATSHYVEGVKVENQFDDADYNWMAEKNEKDTITYLNREDWEATYPTSRVSATPHTSDDGDMRQYYTADIYENGPKYTEGDGSKEENTEPYYNIPYIDDNGDEYLITFNDMTKVPLEGVVEDGKFAGKEGADIWDAFIKQMDLDDLIISVSDNRGILDVKKVLKKGNSVAEGPEGLLAKFQYGDKRWATGFPTGPTYTGTFDHEMQKKYGGFFGEECLYCGVACVNAPGCNINRTPYGSRASEYMSEDAILNYNTAANIVGQARRKGLIMNIKHCMLNNQESGRKGVYTYCNEQAIREIYIKPFEGALTKGHGLGIMTSYNRIGARYAACHAPLMNNVMRGEWGYKGLIIDDAYADGNGNNASYSFGPAMLYNGTDLFCLDGQRGGQLKNWITGHDDGTLLLQLQRANKYIMYSISRSWMGGIRVSAEEIEASMNPWWKKTVNGLVVGTTVVSAILVGVYVFFEVFEIISKNKKAKNDGAEAE